MKNEVHYLMSQKQLNRYVALSKLIEGKIDSTAKSHISSEKAGKPSTLGR